MLKRDTPQSGEIKAMPYAKLVPVKGGAAKSEQEQATVKAAFYGRFSSVFQNDDEESGTIASQFLAVKRYAETNQIQICQSYIDEALSAKDDKRPQFQQMIADAKAGKFSVILAYKLDRFSRNLKHHLTYADELKKCGVRVVAVEGGFDDSTPEGWMGTVFTQMLSEYYLKNLSRDVKRGKKIAFESGKWTGGRPPLGYTVNRETLKLEVVPELADSVKLIYQLTLEGRSYREIANILNSMGRKNAFGKPFNDYFADTLRNTTYLGLVKLDMSGKCLRREVYPDNPNVIFRRDESLRIISDELFNAVQDKFRYRYKRGAMKRTYLLTGLIRCKCGYAMTGMSRARWARGKKQPRYFSYHCCSPKSTKTGYKCTNNHVSMTMLNEFVIETIRDLVHNPARVASLMNEALDAEGKDAKITQNDIMEQIAIFKERVRKTALDTWKSITALLVKDILVDRETAELHIRLNAFLDGGLNGEQDDIVYVFFKSRLALRKLPFYNYKNKNKETSENENQDNQ